MMMLRNLSLDFEISQDTWIKIAELEEDQSKSFFPLIFLKLAPQHLSTSRFQTVRPPWHHISILS